MSDLATRIAALEAQAGALRVGRFGREYAIPPPPADVVVRKPEPASPRPADIDDMPVFFGVQL